MEMFWSVTKENFKPFSILKRFNVDHSFIQYFKCNIGYGDKSNTQYHEWSSNLDAAKILTKQEADELFHHMINHHRGENYRIVRFETFEQYQNFNPKLF